MLAAAGAADAQQATIQDVCAQGQMRDADGTCVPGTGMGEAGAEAGAQGEGPDATRFGAKVADPAAPGAGAPGDTDTMPNAAGAKPDATRFGAEVADPNAGGGTGQ